MKHALPFLLGCLALVSIHATATAQEHVGGEPRFTREQALGVLKPYTGPSEVGVDRSTLTGKLMCGYQGWFTAKGDRSGLGWFPHYVRKGEFGPGSTCIDLWPDVSELDADEKYPTPFKHADGRVAQVFSSYNRKTVLRHFRWMHDYHLDGVFVQRFVVRTYEPNPLNHVNVVLDACREGANTRGRAYAVMYDLSGMEENQMQRAKEDWKSLVDRMKLGRDPNDKAYLHHNGKPVVAVWGIGFSKRKYTLAECADFINFLKNDPVYGGNTVMLGIPHDWREKGREGVDHDALLRIIKSADIVSPWTVGRYRTPDEVRKYSKTMAGDVTWCNANRKDFLPVVYPGFSWHNLNPDAPFNAIPRLGGEFLWTQFVEAKKAGATMIYQAMFDEMDEGTAIFKCTNDPPVGASKFLTYEKRDPDYYLWLVGEAARLLLQEEKMTTEAMPERSKSR